MVNKKFNRHTTASQDIILVATGNQAVATGALVAAGNTVNIGSGQLGTLSTDFSATGNAANNFITAGQTALQVKTVKVLRGTPNSTNLSNVSPFNLNDQMYLKSAEISPSKVLEVNTTLPEVGQYDMQYMSAFTAPTVATTYVANLVLESVTKDIQYAPQRRDWRTYAVTTPATAPTDPTDWLLQNLALKANQESIWFNGAGRPFIVFGIATDGTPGTVINTVANGTSIPYMTVGGTSYSYVANYDFVQSLTKAVSGSVVAGTASIVNLGSVTPGSATTVDALLVVGLDEVPAAIYDEETRNKVRVNMGIEGAVFTTATASVPKDWVGTGKQWKLEWKRRMGPRVYFQNWYSNPLDGGMELVPSYITNDASTLYTSTIILFNDVEQNTTNEAFITPHRLVILLPAAISNTTDTVADLDALAGNGYTVATTATTTVTQLNASLGAWLSSASSNFSNIQYNQAATAAAPFV